MKKLELGNHIFAVNNFLSSEDCARCIDMSEEKGYEKAVVNTEKGTKIVENVRNNNRILFKNQQLASSIWEKIGNYVPAKIGNSYAIGLNELFRFYKYESGQQFKRHTDESYIRNENEASYYTLLIYLNEDYQGGETIFDQLSIKVTTGMALWFLHALPHEGAAVTEGVKYVLRTDIMYKLGSYATPA